MFLSVLTMDGSNSQNTGSSVLPSWKLFLKPSNDYDWSFYSQVNGDIPPKVKHDAHAMILDFIRSRPPLHPVSDPLCLTHISSNPFNSWIQTPNFKHCQESCASNNQHQLTLVFLGLPPFSSSWPWLHWSGKHKYPCNDTLLF